MRYPKLQPIPKSVTSQIDFRGLNRQYTVSEKEFVAQQNISGENYPVLSPRKRKWRATLVSTSQYPVLDCLVYDNIFYFVWEKTTTTPHTIELRRSTTDAEISDALASWSKPDGDYKPKMVYMNGYICIFPDAKFYNIEKSTLMDGNIDLYYDTVDWSYSTPTGRATTKTDYVRADVSGLDVYLHDNDYITLRFPKGDSMANGHPDAYTTYYTRVVRVTSEYVIFDNSTMDIYASTIHARDLRIIRHVPLLDYACVEQNRLWGVVKKDVIDTPAYERLRSNDVNYLQHDLYLNNPYYWQGSTPITLSLPALQDLSINADHADIYDNQNTLIASVPVTSSAVSTPDVQLVCPTNWTSEYLSQLASKIEDDVYAVKIVWKDNTIRYNDIRASELGTPYSFECFEGTAMDSYAVDVASEGDWTAIFPYKNTVYGFKEDVIHSVYGYYPSNYKLTTDDYKGVKKNCDRSVCVYNNVLYWYSKDGLVAYSGRKPVIADRQLSDVFGTNSAAVCCASDKDTLYCCTEKGVFGYNGYYNLWSKHSDAVYKYAFPVNGELVFSYQNTENQIYLESASYDALVALHFLTTTTHTSLAEIRQEDVIDWMAQSARILMYGGESVKTSGYNYQQKYVQQLFVKADVPLGSRLSIYISYDDGDFEPIATQNGNGIGIRVIPIIPRRCDHFALRFNGHGDAKVISVTKQITGGSEVVRNV